MNTTPVILLVEDNEDDVDLTLRAFRKCAVRSEIVVARDGVEALDYVFCTGGFAGRDSQVQPEVIFLDLKLPRLDGIDVLRRLRGDERTKRIPVVVLTSSRETRDMTQCYDLGANSFVRKPVDFAAFTDTAQRLSEYWLMINERPLNSFLRETGR